VVDNDGEPLGNRRYVLTAGDKKFEGVTDADGGVEAQSTPITGECSVTFP
jgi:hypothetical protein